MNTPVLTTRKRNEVSKKWGKFYLIFNLILCIGLLTPICANAMMASSEDDSINSQRIKTSFNDDSSSSVIHSQGADISLQCIGFMQISIGTEGFATVHPSNFVIAGDISNTTIIINGVERDSIFCDEVGSSLIIEVRDTVTTQSCWSTAIIEDKLHPFISCDTVRFSCTQDPFDPTLVTMPDSVSDNCGTPGLMFNDGPYTEVPCDTVNDITGQFIRTWTATDGMGNSAQCNQVILFERLPLDSVSCPPNDTMYCPTYNLDPSVTGEPNYNGEPLHMQCGIVFWHEDSPPGYLCAGEFKIIRTWTIMDWCTNEMITCTQDLMVFDTTGPVIDCPNDMVLSTDHDDCDLDYTLPEISAYDSCSMDVLSFGIRIDTRPGAFIAGDVVTLDTGMHVLTYTVRDDCNNSSVCSFKITVEDQQDPQISCNPQMVVLSNGGTSMLSFPNFDVTASDNCILDSIAVRRVVDNCMHPEDLVFGTEVHFCCEDVGEDVMVEYIAIDQAGNSTSVMCAITVKDQTDPIITCPMDITVSPPMGSPICEVVVPIPDPMASDNCGEPIITNDAPAAFPLGCTTVVFTATDASGNTDTCHWKVTVVDEVDPMIVCPADTTIECNTPTNPVGLGMATATDNCGTPVVTFMDVETPGTCPQMMTITRTWTATDDAGNTAQCTQIITVEDRMPPVITFCPPNLALECGMSTDTADTGVALAIDNCDGAIITFSDNEVVGTCPQMMILTRTWRVEDACGNIDSCQQIITLDDTEAPVITCPANVTVACGESIDPADTGMATARDDCNGATISSNDVSAVGSCPQEMIITRTWRAEDSCGNADVCDQLITVIDTVAPIITCPADMTINCDAPLPDGAATATDACAPDVDVVITSTIIPNGFMGGVLRRWFATDPCGNMDSCDQRLTIIDMTPPVVNCPADITMDNDPDLCGAMVDVMVTDTSDNCGIVSITNSFNDTDDPSGFYPVGTTEVTVIVTDGGGLMDTCMFNVTVVDTMPPSITCLDSISVPTDIGVCEAMIDIPIPDTSDNCGVMSLINDFNMTSNASDTYPVGETNVTWTVTDVNGLMSTCLTRVIVRDTMVPTITCPDTTFGFADAIIGCAGEIDPVLFPAFNDNCGVVSLVNSIDGDTDASGIYPVGITEVVWTVTDAAGNSASCTAIVEVRDTISPVIVCPMDIVQATDLGLCRADITIPLPDTSDNCGVLSVVNNSAFANSSGIDASGVYPIGTTTIKYTIVDIHGNMSMCSFDVTVTNSGGLTITCPNDTLVGCDFMIADLDGFPGATAMNDCTSTSVPVMVSVENNLDETCNTGTIIRTFMATSGDITVSCMQTITVQVDDPFTEANIVCPDTLVEVDVCDMDLSPGAIGSMVSIIDTAGLDCFNISVDFEDQDVTRSDFCRAIERTWTIIDSCQNLLNPADGIFTCTQIIGINDDVAPALIVADTFMYFLSPTDTTCEISVTLPIATATDCSEPVTITNSSPFAMDGGADASGDYPIGETLVEFTAVDFCGNEVMDTMVVQVRDTILPEFDCVKTEHNIEPNLEVTATIENVVTDTCRVDFFRSFTPFDKADTLKVFDCSFAGNLHSFTIFIFNDFGSIDSCTAIFEVRDPNEFCNMPVVSIGGTTKTEYDGEVPYAMVHMMNRDMEVMTDQSGHYQFDDLVAQGNYTFRPERDGDFTNGLSTLDMIGIIRHVLGIDILESPYQQIAADVDGNGNVNILDVLKLQQVILYLQNQIPENTSWRFVDRSYVFQDPFNAMGEDFPETMSYNPVMTDRMNSDFVAIKVGDVNGTASPDLNPIELRGSRSIDIEYDQANDGSILFKAGESLKVDGYQMSIVLPTGASERYDVVSMADERESFQNYRWMDDHTLGLTVVNVEPIEINVNDIVFELRLKKGQEFESNFYASLHDGLTPEIYQGSEIADINLKPANFDKGAFELFQNEPNPFTESSIIRFIMPTDQEVLLTLFDINGSKIGSTKYAGIAGENEIMITREMLGSAGLYYYELSTDEFRAVKKLIFTP